MSELVNMVRGNFKTQLPVDRRFRLVPGGYHCLEQKKPTGTAGQLPANRRPTGGCFEAILNRFLSKSSWFWVVPIIRFCSSFASLW